MGTSGLVALFGLVMQDFHRPSSSIEVKGQIISEDVQKYPNITQGGPKFAKISERIRKMVKFLSLVLKYKWNWNISISSLKCTIFGILFAYIRLWTLLVLAVFRTHIVYKPGYSQAHNGVPVAQQYSIKGWNLRAWGLVFMGNWKFCLGPKPTTSKKWSLLVNCQ